MIDIEQDAKEKKKKSRPWTAFLFLGYLLLEILTDSVVFGIRLDRETWTLFILGFELPLIIAVSLFVALIVLAIVGVMVGRHLKKKEPESPPAKVAAEPSPYDFDPDDYKL